MNIYTIIGLIIATLGLILNGLSKKKKSKNFSILLIFVGLGALWFQAIGTKKARKKMVSDITLDAKSNKSEINTKIESESSEVKNQLNEFDNQIQKLQHPIPSIFSLWITLEIELDSIDIIQEKEDFNLFDSFFLFIMLHKDLEKKSYSNGELPKTIELRTANISTSTLIEENKLFLNQ